jgi:hypothetical protein
VNPLAHPVGLAPKGADLLGVDGDRLAERITGHLPEVEHGCQQDLRAA